MTKYISRFYRDAPLSSIMTIISFFIFLLTYLYLITQDIHALYFYGLLLLIPFLCFATITTLTILGKLSTAFSTKLAIVTILLLAFLFWIYLVRVAIDVANPSTTDIKQYERTLRLVDYPKNQATKHFPDKVPDSAKDVQFSYHPAFAQGSEVLCLKYKIDSDSIATYTYRSTQNSKWIGNPDDCTLENSGILKSSLSVLDYAYHDLPSDLKIYSMYSQAYRINDWNHGETGFTAVSQERNEVLFVFDRW